jgi:tetratricopeptide (TPR) repeat protein
MADADAERPDLIVDLATLTGAARVALGPEVHALFCNDDAVADGLLRASAAASDPLWRMPLWQPYRKLIDSKVADFNNVAESPFAGAIIAALYLAEFVKPSTPWAHIDMMASNTRDLPGRPEGGEATDPGVDLTLARIYLRTGGGDKAIGVLSRLVVDEPGRPEPVSLLVEAYQQAGRSDEAIRLLESTVTGQPQFYAPLGELYEQRQQWTDAADAYENRGSAYAKKGESNLAIADFSEAIRLAPEYALAYGDRGTAYYYKGDLDKAIADCTKAIRLKPDEADAYRIRGFAYYYKGDRDKAKADFAEAIRLGHHGRP